MDIIFPYPRRGGLQEGTVWLIMETFQKECLDVHISLLGLTDHIIQLRVELEHMQWPFLAVDILMGIELCLTDGSCRGL